MRVLQLVETARTRATAPCPLNELFPLNGSCQKEKASRRLFNMCRRSCKASTPYTQDVQKFIPLEDDPCLPSIVVRSCCCPLVP